MCKTVQYLRALAGQEDIFNEHTRRIANLKQEDMHRRIALIHRMTVKFSDSLQSGIYTIFCTTRAPQAKIRRQTSVA